MRQDVQVSSSGSYGRAVPLCSALPDHPHEGVRGKRFCALHEAEHARAMNAWHQACFRARQMGHQEPDRELYESRIKFTSPANVGMVLTQQDRQTLRQCANQLAEAAYAVELASMADRLPAAHEQTIMALLIEVRATMATVREMADAPLPPTEPGE